MNTWRIRLRAFAPVPLAAPESRPLRNMRLSMLGALALLGVICLFWSDFSEVAGIFGVALVAALVVYLAVLVPVWLCRKIHADDAWLLRERHDD
ncbi:MAG: hypothetical protein V4521_16665 [Pseudomonadota bacterium]